MVIATTVMLNVFILWNTETSVVAKFLRVIRRELVGYVVEAFDLELNL